MHSRPLIQPSLQMGAFEMRVNRGLGESVNKHCEHYCDLRAPLTLPKEALIRWPLGTKQSRQRDDSIS